MLTICGLLIALLLQAGIWPALAWVMLAAPIAVIGRRIIALMLTTD